MNILDEVLGAGGGKVLQQVASQFGLPEQDARNAINSLLPALSQGVKRNVQQDGGLDSLLSALSSGNHGRYIDNPELLADTNAAADGNHILGHILGGKQTSRDVADRAAQSTGLDLGMLKQMLPVLAGLAMGAMSKRAPSNVSEMDSGELLGGLGSFLDLDNDGSVADDVLDFARKLF